MCIDNFPVPLLRQLITNSRENDNYAQMAVSVDARSPTSDLASLPAILSTLSDQEFRPRVVYLDALGPVLVKRFDETRRRHPLEQHGLDLLESIENEKKLLSHLADLADLKLDTTRLSIHELTTTIKELLIEGSHRDIMILFRSFAFRHGVPVDADFVFDVRCLPNPYWDSNLRRLDGKDEAVKNFLDSEDSVQEMFQQLVSFLNHWLPSFQEQRRAYVTIAIGCTGGRHRSVYMTERLAAEFRMEYSNVLIRHREQSTSATQ